MILSSRMAFWTLVVATVNGCAGSTTPPRTPADPWSAEYQIPVTDEMRSQVLRQYGDVVRSGLKAPSTANVHPPTTILASYDPAGGRQSLWAMGVVDAQNSFGAMLRSDYTIVMSRKGRDGKWDEGIMVGCGPLELDVILYGRLSRLTLASAKKNTAG